MTETINTFGELSDAEFDQMIKRVASPDFHDLPMPAFATALAAIDAEAPSETVELIASVENGQLALHEPAPLHAHGNAIQFGGKRVVIRIAPAEVSQAA
ncbi:MAG: hypothetical protein HOP19_01015 [Acidobacteria bacterium]|nr:hypothetical protein [Acidobacteriota bacterium]